MKGKGQSSNAELSCGSTSGNLEVSSPFGPGPGGGRDTNCQPHTKPTLKSGKSESRYTVEHESG